jgi:hypothetical protein
MVLNAALNVVKGLAFIAFICPLALRDDLLPCVEQMDGDHDGTIVESEIDAFYAAHSSCLSSSFLSTVTGATTISQCDMDGSGNLTIADWNHASGCFQKRSRQMVLCQACQKCGLFPVLVKK